MLLETARIALLDDYIKAGLLRRLYVRLYKSCYKFYYISKNKIEFDQEGYLLSENGLPSYNKVSLGYIRTNFVLSKVNNYDDIPTKSKTKLERAINNIQEIIPSIEEMEKNMSSNYYQKYIKGEKVNGIIMSPRINVLDAKYPHYHWAAYCVKHELNPTQRKNYYTKMLMNTDKVQLNHFRYVRFPNIYKQKWVNSYTYADKDNSENGQFTNDVLIQYAEDVLRIYGETDTIPHPKKKIVFLTGSGISQESGIPTIRDEDGLWLGYPIKKVASHNGWLSNPELVNIFFNNIRKEYVDKSPNMAHKIIAYINNLCIECSCESDCCSDCDCDSDNYCDMCDGDLGFNLNRDDFDFGEYDVCVVTQNIDNLHELADITKTLDVVHTHGEYLKVCASDNENDTRYQWKLHEDSPIIDPNMKVKDRWNDTLIGNKRMRPFVVLFGEEVPLWGRALHEVETASLVVVVGTSLTVYPYANLIDFVPMGVPIVYIDPNPASLSRDVFIIEERATDGMITFLELFKSDYFKSLL